MEDLAVFTALNHSGSFGKNLVKFKKNEYIIYRLKVGPYGENCFSPNGPPGRQITYIYLMGRGYLEIRLGLS